METADPRLAKPIIKKAQELERKGVSAITSDCGYMAVFQKEVSASVNIPVFLSSFMQVPFIYRILPPQKKIGVIVANRQFLRNEMLINSGIDDSIPLVFGGMEDKPGFRSAIWDEEGLLDSDLIEAEVVSVANEIVRANRNIGAILLECSDLPPFAHAVQQSVKLPVFDYITMINFVFSSLVNNIYKGTIY